MVKYRRNKITGGLYFFTVNLHDRKSNLLTVYFDLLYRTMTEVKLKYPYKTEAIVILPDHIHVLWQLPPDDVNYSLRWQRIKGLFTHKLIKRGVKFTKDQSGEYDLWQKRFWEHTINNEIDLENHINYIHYNPIKHNLVKHLKDWPYSSFHRYVKQGLLPIDWSSYKDDKNNAKKFGE